MQNYIAIGISLPKEILTRIDTKRGDVARSRYLLRLIENALKGEE
jgi:metal-responsive CopG/Arc/MetJ family transcriptional regulator